MNPRRFFLLPLHLSLPLLVSIALALVLAACLESAPQPQSPAYSSYRRSGVVPATPPFGGSTAARTGEFRAMWVSRFEWPNKDKAECKRRIDQIMSDLADHGFNAVMFQVRGQMDVLFPSPYEPWSQEIGNPTTGPGWDPLRYAIQSAHARGLEFHAYVNTHTAWQSGSNQPPPHSKPEHPFWLHLNEKGNHDWLICDPSGRPVQWESSGYVWCAPGVPEFCWWTRRVVMQMVRNYDIDGIHFDRIRVPAPLYSHDPISMTRMAGAGNPARLDFADWTRDQVTRMLNDIYGEIAATKPWIKVTASPFGIFDRTRIPGYGRFNDGFNNWLQDSQGWLRAGVVDAIIPQIYWGMDSSGPRFDVLLRDWMTHSYGRHIYAGQTIEGSSFSEMQQQIAVSRAEGALGNCLFSYRSVSAPAFDQYAAGPYAQRMPTPSMPWKTNPSTGIILGYVTAPHSRTPVTDAWVRREGVAYTWLSGHDGFYVMLNVPPGTYTLTAAQRGTGGVRSTGISVAAGKVTRADLPLFPPAP